MHPIDWLIVLLPILVCGGIAIYSRRYVRSVADFMAGGRNAGRYLLCTARSEQGSGAVVFVAAFQVFAVAGFTMTWWDKISIPVTLLIAISGFVIYRYRQTRAMTLAQFLEMRYSRRFRLFAGGLAFVAGMINFGIIPVIGAQFMVHFMGLPAVLHAGSLIIPTHLLLMALFLTVSVATTTLGGQVTVLLTDCAEGMISQVLYVGIALALLLLVFSVADTKAMLLDTKPGHSLVNPFDSFSHKDFNLWFTLMGIVISTYATMAWQNSHAFHSSAINAHESRMGSILGKWRGFAVGVMVTMLVVCALTWLHDPVNAAVVQGEVAAIADPSLASQMQVPLALGHLLPVGVKGMLLAVCLMGIVAGDGIHLHSWSSILVQDVIMPLRKKPLSTQQHIRLLRTAVIGVAVFAFCFGALFPQTEYVQIWFSVTQAIFTGGAGAAIIGGLYWSRGTSAGAWTGLIVGSTLSFGGILLRIWWQHALGHEFWLNGREIAFAAVIAAVASYVIVSLVTCRKPHDMDRLLHRGAHAVAGDAVAASAQPVGRLRRLLGIDARFTRGDRAVTYGVFAWSMLWFGIFACGSVAYLVHPWSNAAWASYWVVMAIYVPLAIGVLTTIWFTIGCWFDIRVFIARLRAERPDSGDDGRVEHHDEEPAPPSGAPQRTPVDVPAELQPGR